MRIGVVNYRENFVSKVVIYLENLHKGEFRMEWLYFKQTAV